MLSLGSTLSLLVMLLPLISFLLLISLGRGRETWAWLGTGIQLGAALAAALVFSLVWQDGEVFHARTVWFRITTDKLTYTFTLGILIDQVAALMMLVVTTVSALVHIYSIDYMRGDRHYTRYFAYLGLFTFSMLGIVIMDNLLTIFIFWELVGVSSYALISFWNHKPAALQAGSKAFIMNRIGDAGFLVGLMILWSQFGTLDLQVLERLMQQSVLSDDGMWLSNFRNGGRIFENAAPAVWLTLAGLGLFGGTVGKSAQFPLQTWLPDAMQGPTPASALIHAATMVAAGVYLLARVFVLLNGDALTLIAFTGAITALMGAVAALSQNDIKRVLAFSTISQLGYMVMSIGVGAYDAALFHLVTHAVFKACLFLSAGAVIHAMQHMAERSPLTNFDPQDMRMMGGLRKAMPYTFVAYLIAGLSLSGLPLFSGFLSKDAILAGTLAWVDAISGNPYSIYALVSVPAFATTLLTALYMGKQLLLVFGGEMRACKAHPALAEARKHLHDAPALMMIPMIVLAACSLSFAFSLNPLDGEQSWLTRQLPIPLLAAPGEFDYYERIARLKPEWHATASLLASVLAVTGLLLALLLYRPGGKFARQYHRFERADKGIRALSYHNWYLDHLYRLVVLQPIIQLARLSRELDWRVINRAVDLLGVMQVVLAHLVSWVDRFVVDGAVSTVSWLSRLLNWLVRPAKNARIQTYFIVSMLLFMLLIYWVLI
jgi:NADH-quinone oxidoreductase subunit L